MGSESAFQFIVLLAFLIPLVLFIITQQNTLRAIQPQNRLMPAGQVWLQLVPIFGLFWQFNVVSKISGSLQRQLSHQHQFSFDNNELVEERSDEKPTYSIGIAYCALYCCSIIPVLGVLAALAGMVCWVIYWVKLAGYKRKLHQTTF